MIRFYISRDGSIFSVKDEEDQDVLEAQGFIGYDSWRDAYVATYHNLEGVKNE
jgi:hypothetical protein